MKRLLLLVTLAACPGKPINNQITQARYGGAAVVDSVVLWQNRGDVPRRYQHVVDWEGRTSSVYVIFSGPKVCVLADSLVPFVAKGDRPTCSPWLFPRGV